MAACKTTDRLVHTYLAARLSVAAHPDDPSPVADAWIAWRTTEMMLLRQGWSEEALEAAYRTYESEQLRALDVEGWRLHLAAALARSTTRSVRIAQALEHYYTTVDEPRDDGLR